MTLHAIRSVSALGFAVLLAACGGGQPDQSAQTAVAMQSGAGADALASAPASAPASAGAPAAAVQAGAPAAAQVAANMPAPDCAAEGCKSLRIIDANAEIYRYQAMRRGAAVTNT